MVMHANLTLWIGQRPKEHVNRQERERSDAQQNKKKQYFGSITGAKFADIVKSDIDFPVAFKKCSNSKGKLDGRPRMDGSPRQNFVAGLSDVGGINGRVIKIPARSLYLKPRKNFFNSVSVELGREAAQKK